MHMLHSYTCILCTMYIRQSDGGLWSAFSEPTGLTSLICIHLVC